MGVDADKERKGDEGRKHEDKKERHKERHKESGRVKIELGDFHRAADDERNESADHSRSVDPRRRVQLPARPRE
jgi:hypothetical protein